MSSLSPDPIADDEPETIELENAEGEVVLFELLAVIELEERLFAALTPHKTDIDKGEMLDLHLFHYEEFPPDDGSSEGYWSVKPVEDEALEERVFSEVQQLLLTAALDG